mmetsp:Transcript_27179/g.63653  ORF Transcript_27179/g.63653 Transcript_27179/m.63653 type:complete len:305 (+) Transcript_27179:151-1065(+)
MAAVIESRSRIKEVRIEGLAMMKIIKHCQESLPNMVQGALLGLAVEGGVLEVTHAFPNPSAKNIDDDIDLDYRMEMMHMLKEVNVDNNCVGLYQSMYLGVYSTTRVLENQFEYQTDVSPNAVVILYDPIQTARGSFCIKAFRLSAECMALKKSGKNEFIKPSTIFEEIPVVCTNPGLATAMLKDWTPPSDIALDRLDMSTQPYLEKHLESLCGWVDELAGQQQNFQHYTRQLARSNNKSKHSWASNEEAPQRMESLLVTNQIEKYCEQMDKYVGGGLGKLFLAGGLHKEERSTSATTTTTTTSA